MGLDIYFYRTKVAQENDFDYAEVINQTNKEAQDNIRKVYNDLIKKLQKKVEKGETENFSEEMTKAIKRLAKEFTYPEFDIGKLGYHEKLNPETKEWEVTIIPCSLETFISEKDEIIGRAGAKHQGYFRKVNFLFEYFKKNMVNDVFSWVSRGDVEILIERCKTILAEKDEAKRQDLAEELLPTCSGFFFGSTAYDNWYYIVLKDCLSQMKALLKEFDKGYNMYVYFSW